MLFLPSSLSSGTNKFIVIDYSIGLMHSWRQFVTLHERAICLSKKVAGFSFSRLIHLPGNYTVWLKDTKQERETPFTSLFPRVATANRRATQNALSLPVIRFGSSVTCSSPAFSSPWQILPALNVRQEEDGVGTWKFPNTPISCASRNWLIVAISLSNQLINTFN